MRPNRKDETFGSKLRFWVESIRKGKILLILLKNLRWVCALSEKSIKDEAVLGARSAFDMNKENHASRPERPVQWTKWYCFFSYWPCALKVSSKRNEKKKRGKQLFCSHKGFNNITILHHDIWINEPIALSMSRLILFLLLNKIKKIMDTHWQIYVKTSSIRFFSHLGLWSN